MRYKIIYVIIAVFCLAAVSRLVDLQLVKGDTYREQSRQKVTKTSAIPAPRGEILDRNGQAFVKNKTGFSVEIHYSRNKTSNERNLVIARLYNVITSSGQKIYDSFPVSADGKSFLLDEKGIKEWKTKQNLKENMTVAEVMSHFKKEYSVEDFYTPSQTRAIIGVR